MEENEMKIMKIVNKANNGQISEKDLAEKLKIKCPILDYIHDLRHKRHIKYSGSTEDGHIIELTREGKQLVEKI